MKTTLSIGQRKTVLLTLRGVGAKGTRVQPVNVRHRSNSTFAEAGKFSMNPAYGNQNSSFRGAIDSDAAAFAAPDLTSEFRYEDESSNIPMKSQSHSPFGKMERLMTLLHGRVSPAPEEGAIADHKSSPLEGIAEMFPFSDHSQVSPADQCQQRRSSLVDNMIKNRSRMGRKHRLALLFGDRSVSPNTSHSNTVEVQGLPPRRPLVPPTSTYDLNSVGRDTSSPVDWLKWPFNQVFESASRQSKTPRLSATPPLFDVEDVGLMKSSIPVPSSTLANVTNLGATIKIQRMPSVDSYDLLDSLESICI